MSSATEIYAVPNQGIMRGEHTPRTAELLLSLRAQRPGTGSGSLQQQPAHFVQGHRAKKALKTQRAAGLKRMCPCYLQHTFLVIPKVFFLPVKYFQSVASRKMLKLKKKEFNITYLIINSSV